MSCSILFPLPNSFYRDSSFNQLNEKNQWVASKNFSHVQGNNSSSLLDILFSSFISEMHAGPAFLMELLYMIEEYICGPDIDLRKIGLDSQGRTFLHQLVLLLDEPVGVYSNENKKLIKILEKDNASLLPSSHEFDNITAFIFSKNIIHKTIKNYAYSIKKDLKNQAKHLKKNKEEVDLIYDNLDYHEMKNHAEILAENFYKSVKYHVVNFNLIDFDINYIIYSDSIILPKTGPEQAVKEVSEFIKDTMLKADLYNFAKELTIFDKIIFGLVVRGINVNAITAYTEETALHLAVQQQNCFLLVLALLKHGANPNLPNKFCETALHLIIQAENALPVVSTLLKYGANPDLPDINLETALHLAVKVESTSSILPTLLKHGANPNLPNKNGQTALHLAAKAENALLTVPILLDYRADPALRDNNGLTAIDIAYRDNNHDLVKLLKLEIPPKKMQGGKTATVQQIDEILIESKETKTSVSVGSATETLQQILSSSRTSKQTSFTRFTQPLNAFLKAALKGRTELINLA